MSSPDQEGFGFPTSRFSTADRENRALWPNGARMAVLVYTAPESWDWSEEEPAKPFGSINMGESINALSTRTAVEYGYNLGLPRMRKMFADFDMKVTLWTSGRAVEEHRGALEAMLEDGHHLEAHSYSQGKPMPLLSGDEQREAIERSVELLTDVAGSPPRGWIGPAAAATTETIELLGQAGFDFNADLQDDELPYFLEVGGRQMLEIPYRMVGNLNDLLLLLAGYGVPKSPKEALEHLTSSFDAYYEAAASHPLIFNYGTHPYVSGRPDTLWVMYKFLEHVHSFSDVWVCNYRDIADWWRGSYESLVVPGGGFMDADGIATR